MIEGKKLINRIRLKRIMKEEIIDGIKYRLDEYNFTAEVVKKSGGYDGDIIIPETVDFNDDSYRVTSIEYSAFENCSSLTSIVIPDIVTSIGRGAFRNCCSLTDITIPDSVTSIDSETFNNCSSLTSIVVAKGNTIYDSRENCNAIIKKSTNTLICGCQNTAIPDSVMSIGAYAFKGRSSLIKITIPDSITSIGWGAFDGCFNLKSIAIPGRVNSIGGKAFHNCSSLTEITIPDKVAIIDSGTFENCSSLTSVVIPDSVTSIGDEAFLGCSSLTSVVIPNSVMSIGDEAFEDCESLIQSPTIEIKIKKFSYRLLKHNHLAMVTRYSGDTQRVVIPSEITYEGVSYRVMSIGYSAFRHCHSLKKITIPDGVKSIGDYAFADCDSLTSVVIPDSVTSIGDHAFYYCI